MALKAKPLLDRATEPRPMSEAPRVDAKCPSCGTTEGEASRLTGFLLAGQTAEDYGQAWCGSCSHFSHASNWLPTSSGGEWPEHGEGWSDEVALSGGGES